MAFFRKITDRPPETTSVSEEMKRNKIFGLRDVIVCLVIVVVFLISKNGFGIGLGSYGGLAPVLEETRFGITGLDGNTHFFNYADADSIELFDDLKSLDIGEKVEGQEDYVTKEVIATFDVESDLFVKWDIVLNGGQAFGEAIDAIQEATTNALIDKAVPQTFSHESFSSVDFTFKGSYLGAEIYGPKDASGKYKVMGTSPTLPVGAYYLGYDPDHGVTTPQFFKSKGIATWSPYCALVNASAPVASGAKEFDTLDIDFNGLSDNIVVTGIGNPTIQIPVTFTNDKVYNLNGQVVRENSKDLSGLKGIFIVGGKKVVIK